MLLIPIFIGFVFESLIHLIRGFADPYQLVVCLIQVEKQVFPPSMILQNVMYASNSVLSFQDCVNNNVALWPALLYGWKGLLLLYGVQLGTRYFISKFF